MKAVLVGQSSLRTKQKSNGAHSDKDTAL
uniref:Uncharacterized protein n=1 Tax=Anguilla anguilla TaxID=7936 RepID=A0A0E9UXH4_ANGAN